MFGTESKMSKFSEFRPEFLGLSVSVSLKTLETTASIQRGKKVGYALLMRIDYEETQNLKDIV